MTKHFDWNTQIDLIKTIVAESKSYTEVCRKLNRKPVGGSLTHVARFCKIHNIDTSHMTGQGHNKGKVCPQRKSADSILVYNPLEDKGYRIKHSILKRALLEKNVPYQCNICGMTTWQGQPSPLEIDHINSKYWDNRLENLQFICPNCHTIKTLNAPVVE